MSKRRQVFFFKDVGDELYEGFKGVGFRGDDESLLQSYHCAKSRESF